MMKLKFLIYSHPYTAGIAHERFSLYCENEFSLSMSSEARLDELQTLFQSLQLKFNLELKV